MQNNNGSPMIGDIIESELIFSQFAFVCDRVAFLNSQLVCMRFALYIIIEQFNVTVK